MDALLDATQLEHLLRIVLAALCGGAVGFERERRFKSAGIRTHLIVALSAALMTVSGIGFLGAGVIFFRKDAVSGVTTAAGLWATVGIGIALGAGRYFVGCAVTGLIVLIQVVLHHRTPLVRPQKVGTVVLRLTNPQLEAAVCTRLAGMAERIESIHFRRLDGDMVEITCDVIFATDYNAEHLVRALQDIPELYSVEMRWP